MVNLSVIILSYNTRELTKNCLDTLYNSLVRSKLRSEIIIIDNASADDSLLMLDEFRKKGREKIEVIIIKNSKNVGYPKGNNQGIATARGEYILLLNSDVTIDDVDFSDLISYLDSHKNVGVLTVRVNLPQGGIDPASHRGFPTPWNAFTYYSKLERLVGRGILGRFFGGYHLTHKSLSSEHEIDSPAGAFFLTRREILQKANGFDEQYFMYGEDLDLAYRIKKMGYSIVYYPKFVVTHYKHKSGLKSENRAVKHKTRTEFFEAMKIFYKKHYEKKYPRWLSAFIYTVIDLKKKFQ